MTGDRTVAPRTAAPRALGLILALGGLLVTLDTTVAVVALPAMMTDLDSSLPALQWVTTGYLLGVVAVIPTAGWAATRFGARRTYLVALTVFTVASVLVGAAWDVGSLIGFRVLQGLGGGLLNPVGQAIALRAVPRSGRGAMMALLGLPVAVGPVLGPPLSGWLVDAASWRWVFWVTVPVGVLAWVLCRRLLPHPPAVPAEATSLDWGGLVLVSGGGSLLVLGCTLLGESGTPNLPVLTAGGAGVVLLAGFLLRSRRTPAPLLELRLLRHRPLAVGLAVLGVYGAAYFGALSILPLLVQGPRGGSALLAGTLTVPMAVGVGLTLQVATRLVDRAPPTRIVLTGLGVSLPGAAALFLASTTGAPDATLAAAGLLLGVGSGATLMPTMTLAVRDLEDTDTPGGTTLLALVQQLAGALGAAVTATVIALQISTRVPELTGTDQSPTAAMLQLTPTDRADLGPRLADAIGSAYAITATLIVLALAILVANRRGATTPRPSRRTGTDQTLRTR